MRIRKLGATVAVVTAGALSLLVAPALAVLPEVPTTEAPVPVAGTTATLKGELNPGLSVEKVAYHFAYSAGVGATCTESGLTAPVEPFPEAAGNHKKVAVAVTGLEGSTEYAACLVAANSAEPAESTQGTSVSFKTLAEKPKVESESESAVTPFDAILEGQVNPENQEAIYHFEYATNEAFTENVKTLAFGGVGSGVSANQPVGPVDLGGGLTPNTIYYYRVVAKNPTGEVKGTAEHPFGEFKTLPAEKPSVTGERLVGAAGGVSDTIEAQLNPEFQTIPNCELEYVRGLPLSGDGCVIQWVTKTAFEATGFTQGVELALCIPLPPAPELGPYGFPEFGHGGSPVPFTATLTGLQENVAYEYRIVATNATGTFEGAPQALLRTAPQITGAPEVSEVTQHTALIKPSTINPEIEAPLEATYYILYGTGEEGEQLSARTTVGSGLVPNPVAAVQLHGLAPGTTYHYAVVTYNGNATTTGPQQTFTTAPAEPPTPPVVGAQSAQFVNENSAVIEGKVNPGGGETTYAVQYGTTTAYGSSAPGLVAIAPATSTEGTITALTGLAPGTTYHYRIAAANAAGTGYGPDATFTTAGAVRTGTFTPFTAPTVPQIAIIPLNFPPEVATKHLTNKQKLAAALKACAKRHNRAKRARCQRQAHKRYGAKAALRHRTSAHAPSR